ncbi:hypothetical protein SADUNF_Sadunf08G0012400 [Salix dunnii]|uniref:Multiple myeloma tumor-associated protein 2-like N-terminal domain-containing protein n=1 Tax=Salix dunnii TaxID=1413687 RepID=A0A835N0P3_9ROSI|nr:hypothetical protein SADUNF_Sadunf08G0012400 [Salix dunnii]
MYYPTRGGVRCGRDQFSWDDVKADKHTENYLGHRSKLLLVDGRKVCGGSGLRWTRLSAIGYLCDAGKDLHWYVRDTKCGSLNTDALKGELQRIKEEEE